ncbi:unnamed protein product [Sphagnum balticum]
MTFSALRSMWNAFLVNLNAIIAAVANTFSPSDTVAWYWRSQSTTSTAATTIRHLTSQSHQQRTHHLK